MNASRCVLKLVSTHASGVEGRSDCIFSGCAELGHSLIVSVTVDSGGGRQYMGLERRLSSQMYSVSGFERAMVWLWEDGVFVLNDTLQRLISLTWGWNWERVGG